MTVGAGTRGRVSVGDHLARTSPRVAATYGALLEAARALGAFQEEPHQTSIHLTRRTAFAGVAIRKTGLLLTLKSDREIRSGRVKRNQHTSPHRWHAELRLDDPRQVDRQLRAWMARAYALSE